MSLVWSRRRMRITSGSAPDVGIAHARCHRDALVRAPRSHRHAGGTGSGFRSDPSLGQRLAVVVD